jgi:ribosomal-protein-alanine N-acetyltransferase
MAATLVPTAREHAPAIQRLADYPEIATMTPIPHPYPPDGAVRFIERHVLPGRADGTFFGFVMVDEGEVVGHIGLKQVDRERGEAEVGYWVGKSYWGRGYASAAVRLIATIAFEDLGLRRLYAHVLAQNPASGRVLEKAGFVPVELQAEAMPNACATKGETLGYELVASER